eukprot:TRINITY_DN89991_c0_g1_i1.p1 TRINITY_DN89991_c0_g1~~TRINITY_DN89991_c0_g1_i1.p1  ORF type:complete len:1066 (+),score=237.35 TRINITY_DN89991_c0_g1_i1:136-3333(+)
MSNAEFKDSLLVRESQLEISVSSRQLDNAGAERWCAWAKEHLPAFVESEGLARQTNGFLLCKEVNFSSNSIGDKGAHAILKTFYELKLAVRVLKLFKNNLGRAAANALMDWLVATPVPTLELHLSHNYIPREGAVDILKAVAYNPAYPAEKANRSFQPLWLRLEQNLVESPDNLVEVAELQMRKIRQPSTAGPMLTSSQIPVRPSPGMHCPVAQVAYLASQRDLRSRVPAAAQEWRSGAAGSDVRWRISSGPGPARPSKAIPTSRAPAWQEAGHPTELPPDLPSVPPAAASLVQQPAVKPPPAGFVPGKAPPPSEPAKAAPPGDFPAKAPPAGALPLKTPPVAASELSATVPAELSAKHQPIGLPLKAPPPSELPSKAPPSGELPAKAPPAGEVAAKAAPRGELAMKAPPPGELPMKAPPPGELPMKAPPPGELSPKATGQDPHVHAKQEMFKPPPFALQSPPAHDVPLGKSPPMIAKGHPEVKPPPEVKLPPQGLAKAPPDIKPPQPPEIKPPPPKAKPSSAQATNLPLPSTEASQPLLPEIEHLPPNDKPPPPKAKPPPSQATAFPMFLPDVDGKPPHEVGLSESKPLPESVPPSDPRIETCIGRPPGSLETDSSVKECWEESTQEKSPWEDHAKPAPDLPVTGPPADTPPARPLQEHSGNFLLEPQPSKLPRNAPPPMPSEECPPPPVEQESRRPSPPPPMEPPPGPPPAPPPEVQSSSTNDELPRTRPESEPPQELPPTRPSFAPPQELPPARPGTEPLQELPAAPAPLETALAAPAVEPPKELQPAQLGTGPPQELPPARPGPEDLLPAQEVPARLGTEQVQELLPEQCGPVLPADNPGSQSHMGEQGKSAAKVQAPALAESCIQADQAEKADPPADHLAEPFLLPLPDSPQNSTDGPKADGAHGQDAVRVAREPENFDTEDGADQDIIHVPPSPARLPQPTKLHILQRGSAPAAPAFRAPPGLEQAASEEPTKVASAENSSAAAWLNVDDTAEPESDEEELMLPGPKLFPQDGLAEEPELDLRQDHSAEVLQAEIDRQNRVIETLQAKLEEMERACQRQ